MMTPDEQIDAGEWRAAEARIKELEGKLDSLTREHELLKTNAAYLAEGHKRADELQSRLDQMSGHREQAYKELAEVSAENGALRSRLDAAMTLLREVNCTTCDGSCEPRDCRYKRFLVENRVVETGVLK